MSVAARRPSHTRIRSREEVAAKGGSRVYVLPWASSRPVFCAWSRVSAIGGPFRGSHRLTADMARRGPALHDLCASSHFFTFTTLFFSKREAVRDRVSGVRALAGRRDDERAAATGEGVRWARAARPAGGAVSEPPDVLRR